MEEIRLTKYSHGGGCGCKIAPQVLQQMLASSNAKLSDENLLVGNADNDDAAVYKINDELCIISTADFFMPIVDDAFLFGRIAAANSISDIYAMGGKPMMAIALLGWPIQKLEASLAAKVMEGARACCAEAGITIAGGHTIESPEPFFGLSVTGSVAVKNLKQNSTARQGDLLFLTKPLGTGVISTALKRGAVVDEAAVHAFIENLTRLNSLGNKLGTLNSVNAVTDVTGFGILGHLHEMCKGSGLGAELYYNKLPVLAGVRELLAQRITPDATFRNWNNYQADTGFAKGVNVMEAFSLLPDPQTNGGLLIAADPSHVTEVHDVLRSSGLDAFTEPVGVFTERGEKMIMVC